LVITSVVAVATTVSSVIASVDSLASIYENTKALTMSGDPFKDDDGHPGAARYYGSISKFSELAEKTDFGDESINDLFEGIGESADKTKVVADTVSFIGGIASLGNVRDYRVKNGNNINFRYNSDSWKKGYSFSKENVKRNIRHEMGKYMTKEKYKKGAFKIKLVSDSKYNNVYSEKTIKVLNSIKTTDNVMKFTENVDGVYDFYTESDKDLIGISNVTKNITGIGKQTKAFSIYDKYGTKTGKTINNIIDLIGA